MLLRNILSHVVPSSSRREERISWSLARAASGASDCAIMVSQVPEVARGEAQAWQLLFFKFTGFCVDFLYFDQFYLHA